ncbi:hypothetical protein H7171_01865 [Candidatus Saccharibacteria bacterium]|nr:hypothetical protein [Candidatus Saccharibacteria bacterium]
MIEYPSGIRTLNDIEAARFSRNLKIFFAMEVQLTSDQSGSETPEHIAREGLVAVLANPETNTSAADLLIRQHDPQHGSVRGSLRDLYRYHSLIQKANERLPDTTVPRSLLIFMQKLAQDHGEININTEMTTLLANKKRFN